MAGKYGNDSWERPAPPPSHPAPPPVRPPGPPVLPPQPADGGGSYRLDPAALQARRDECDGLIQQLEIAARAAEPMLYVKSPGHEDASGGASDQIKASGRNYIKANESMRDFLKGERNKLDQALQQYQSQDQQAADSLNRRHV